MDKEFSMVIAAKNLFDSVSEGAYEGWLALKGKQIARMGKGVPGQEILNQAEQVFTFTDELVMPGITDTHIFYRICRISCWRRYFSGGGQ